MTYKFQKSLGPLMKKNSNQKQDSMSPQNRTAKADPLGGFSENDLESYTKRSKCGKDMTSGVAYVNFRRRRYHRV